MNNISNRIYVKEKNRGWMFTLFLISPFLAACFAITRLKSRDSLLILFGFCLVYGWLFCPSPIIDAYRYMQQVQQFSYNPSENLAYRLSDFFVGRDETKDIYVYIQFYIASLLGGYTNPNIHHYFYFLVSFVFSLFYIPCVKIFSEQREFKNCGTCFILLFLFVFQNSIFNIQVVRFSTALWIAVYSILQVFIRNNKKYLLMPLVTFLFHGSFFYFIGAFYLSYFFNKKIKILFNAFIASFFFSTIAFDFLDIFSDYLPPVFQHMVYSYTETDAAEAWMKGTYDDAYAVFLTDKLWRYWECLMLYCIYKVRNNLKEEKDILLLGFVLAFMTLTNLASAIPNMGRFFLVGIPIVAILWLRNREELSKYNIIIWLIPIVYAYPLLRRYRYLVETTDITMVSNIFHIIIKNV